MKPFLPCSALEFKINEISTLEYLFKRAFFEGTYDDLHNAITSCYSRYNVREFRSGKKTFDFSFVSDFEIEMEGHVHKVIVHADVKGNYNFMSYSIGISNKDDFNELIRRFHFDYDHKKSRPDQKAFISHLQYGGLSGNGFLGSSFGTTNLEPKLSVPRLNFPPMNLALLLDIVFCEFQNETTKKITENPDWRNLIKNNEIFILKSYFNSISDHIGSIRHNKETLVRDICYA